MSLRQLGWSIAALMAAAAVDTSFAQSPSGLAPDLNASSLARLPYLQRKDVDEATLKALPEVFVRPGPEGNLTGPLAFAAYTPGVAAALFDLHNAAVHGGTLALDARELAILVACRETHYDVGWNAHEPSALKAGVDQRTIDVIRDNAGLAGVSERDAVVIRFGRQLLTERNMDSGTFAKAVELFGERGAMDLVAVMVTYAASGFYAIAVDEQARGGKPPLPRAAREVR
jgi:4-carboxymuconolactone decarboxylase